jgi:tRNA (cmo5U34)-methyltransferase
MSKTPKFDFNTIKDFDTHIDKSIPNYSFLISAVKSISDYFVTENGVIYDIGCSTGKLLNELPYQCKKVGYDNSSLLPISEKENLVFQNKDVTKDVVLDNAQIVYSIFTLQFIEPIERIKLLQKIYDSLNEGGIFILCEKIYQDNGKLQEILTFSHYDYKSKHFTLNDIFSKEKDLRFIMKPKTLQDNLSDLKKVGFKSSTTFFQSFNFVGIIALK